MWVLISLIRLASHHILGPLVFDACSSKEEKGRTSTGTVGVDDDDVIAIESIRSAELEPWPFCRVRNTVRGSGGVSLQEGERASQLACSSAPLGLGGLQRGGGDLILRTLCSVFCGLSPTALSTEEAGQGRAAILREFAPTCLHSHLAQSPQ